MHWGANYWCTWRFLYILTQCALGIAVSVNYLRNSDDFEGIKHELGDTFSNDNWLNIASVAAVTAASLMACVVILACWFDPGSWTSSASPWGKLARFTVSLCSQVSSLCIIAVSSIYLYVHHGSIRSDISGSPWVIVLGGIFFVMIIIDRIMFEPALYYIEFMASWPVRFFSKNTVHVNGNPLRADSAYWLYFRRLYPQIPRLHMMYGSDAQIRGIPLAELMHGSYTQNNKERYRDAAIELVSRVSDMYQLTLADANTRSVQSV